MTEYTMEGKILEKVEEEKEMGVMVHKAMNGSRQVAEAVKKANCALTQIRRTISIQTWDPYLKKDINALEQVQVIPLPR